MTDSDTKIQTAAGDMQRIQSLQSSLTGKSGHKKSTEAISGTTGDCVQLSTSAQDLMFARKLIKAMGDVDEKKVTLIKEQLKNGTYRVDAQKTAAKMLQESLIHHLK